VAHPDDVELLRAHLASVPCSYVVEVAAGNQKRGELRLESDIGVLDAELSPQLDRLAARLREALET
jgi:flagellar biosynthesis/type III secretory pathway protein FliH